MKTETSIQQTARKVPTFESMALPEHKIELVWTLDDLRKPDLGRKNYVTSNKTENKKD